MTRHLARRWPHAPDRVQLEAALASLDARYGLEDKAAAEPQTAAVVGEMIARLGRAYARITDLQGTVVLDLPCGSNSSRAPTDTALLARVTARPVSASAHDQSAAEGFAPQFEPWFCRLLLELGATPVGIDLGDLDGEAFAHHRVDLGVVGSLDFLPAQSFDAVQDSRLFGSPEFTAQFPDRSDRILIAREICAQERRLLKPGGVVIHSDAAALVGDP